MAPHPKSIGPYTILEERGPVEGGTGHLGRREGTNVDALVTRLVLPSAASIPSVRRELRVLCRTPHPGILRIVDEGIDGGSLWYATEVLEARGLRTYCASVRNEGDDASPVPRESRITAPLVDPRARRVRSLQDLAPDEAVSQAFVRRVVDLARRLCVPLAMLHGEGLAHGFLTTNCVAVRPDGRGVIQRLGLDRRARRRSAPGRYLDNARAVGLAPEVVRGERFDGRADLYSLGFILYELLAGRPPLGGSPARGARQHAETRLVPLTRHVRGVPPEVEAIVLRLLATDASDRFPSAVELGDALRGAGASELEDVASAAPRPTIHAPSLRGRSAELSAIESHIARLEEGHGGIVAVTGRAGVGKSRLLARAVELGRARGFFTASGSATARFSGRDARSVQTPFAALLGPLRAIANDVRARGGFECRRVLDTRGSVLARLDPSLASLSEGDQPTPLPVDAARHRIVSYVASTLAAVAEESRMVVTLDDLERADELTIALFESIARQPPGEAAVLFVVACESRACPFFASIKDLPTIAHVALEPMGDEDIRSVAESMSALPPLTDEVIDRVVACAHGDPLLASQLVRLCVGDDSEPLTGASAVDLLGVLTRRVDRLGAPARRALEVLSVIGVGASVDQIASATGLEDGPTLDAVAELERLGLVEESEPNSLAITHDEVARAAYGLLPSDDRVRLHARVGASLAASESVSPGPVARHLEEGGRAQESRPWYLAAATLARDVGAIEIAKHSFRKYFSLGSSQGEYELRTRIDYAADVLARVGDTEEAAEELALVREAARELGNGSIESHALRSLAGLRLDQGMIAEARPIGAEALALARLHRDLSGEGATLRVLALTDTASGLLERARSEYDQALAIAIALGDRREECAIRSLLAVVCAESGDLRTALDMFESGFAIARACGDRRVEANVLANLAILYQQAGQLDRAREAFEGALASLRAAGNRRPEGVTLGHLAALYEAAGRDRKALDLFESALAIHRDVGNVRAVGASLQRIALLEANLGDVDRARRHYAESLSVLETYGDARDLAIALVEVAAIERRAGRSDAAAAPLARARTIAEAREDRTLIVACLCEEGHQALAAGGPASDHWERAQTLAMALGAGPDSDLGRIIARLERAVLAHASGRDTAVGEWVEDLPRAVRRAHAGAGPSDAASE